MSMALRVAERHERMLDAAKAVHRRLGKRQPLEQYEAELTDELRMRGIGIRGRKNTRILFGGTNVGVYLADIIIDGNILVEIKRAAGRLGEDEKHAFGRFIRDGEYQRGYLVNFAGNDLEVATFPAE